MKLSITLFLFFFCSNIIAQPINDSPCLGNSNPPYDLGFDGFHGGTTCDAIGYNDDQNADQQNVYCNRLTDDNAVWYRVNYDSDFDGININITAGTIGNNVAVEVYVGNEDGVCDGTAEFRKSKCDGLPVIDMHIGCLEEDQYIFIKVTSLEGDCGTFEINIDKINDCNIANSCEEITVAQTLNPVTPIDSVFNYTCLSSCLDLSCPEYLNTPGCDFTQNPTVWFQVNIDKDSTQLYSSIITNGSWTPIWSVFIPDPNCDSLINVAGSGSFPCSDKAINPTPLLITSVKKGVYFIAVTADPIGESIDNPNFEICVASILNIEICHGPDFGCSPDDSLVFEIVYREYVNNEPEGPPYLGPFCPGEELTVNLLFKFDGSMSFNDWLSGLIPKFGSGWDYVDFDYNSFAPMGNNKTAEWYEEEGDCAPFVIDKYPFLCTYIGDDGKLKLCNQLCEICPCTGGLEQQDLLPSGYFWVTEGGSPDCDTSECSPAYKYGIGTPVVDVSWSFTMKVKEFDSHQDCLNNNDLSISFMTFADEGAGCWDGPDGKCLVNKPQFSPPWEVNCTKPLGVYIENQSADICSGKPVEIIVSTDEGSDETIKITFEDNSNVDGESDHTFPDGYGTINNILTLNDPDACGPETVTYYAQVVIEGMVCEGMVDTIEIDVYPLPLIQQQEIFGSCMEELPYSLIIEAECGHENNYTFTWEDDLSGKTGIGKEIIIDETFGVGLHTFSITVTDGLGCENTGELQFNVYPKLEFFLQGDTLCWNEYHEFLPYLLGREVSDFNFYWSWETGEGIDGKNEFYEIKEEEYGEVFQPGEWRLCLELSEEHPDGVTCYKATCVDVWIKKPLNISIEPDPIYICDGQVCVDVEIVFDEENDLIFDEVVSISWNGTETNVPFNEYCATGFGEWVDVVTAYGCDTTIYFDILSNNFTITIDSLIHITENVNGSIFISTNMNGNYIFSWTGPENYTNDSQNITGLEKPGCYNLIVTDTLTNCIQGTTICINDDSANDNVFAEINDPYIIPNPNTGEFKLMLGDFNTKNIYIELFSNTGQKIFKEIYQNNQKIKSIPFEFKSLPTGVYIMKIMDKDKTKVLKFIKE